jgi:hypothetical protein
MEMISVQWDAIDFYSMYNDDFVTISEFMLVFLIAYIIL